MAGNEPPQTARAGPAETDPEAEQRRSPALRNENKPPHDSEAWHAPLSVDASPSVLALSESLTSVTRDDRTAQPPQTRASSRLTFSHPSSSESLSDGGQPTAAHAPAATRHSLTKSEPPPPPDSEKGPRLAWRSASFWRRKRVLAVVAVAVMLAVVVVLVVALTFRATAVCPVVSVAAGKYAGVETNGITQWMGIRYAAPPSGENRFAAPRDPEPFEGVVAATQYAPGCPGLGSIGKDAAEDCLFLDVAAPSAATPDSRLPVLVFIQGGGFAAATGHLNGSALIRASGMNLVTVSMTYRAGAFGFLSSREVHERASLNNGLRDQRHALRWVQANVRRFGGDPGRVTLAGQSAGAGSVLQHLAAGGGQDQGLFHAALLQSQSMPPVRPYAAQQYQYDNLVQRTGCGNHSDSLACLRALPAEEFIKHVVPEPFPEGAGGPPVFSYNPVVDGDFITDVPVRALAQGKFVRVPTIFGSVNDEGSIFTPHGLHNETGARRFIRNNFPAISAEQLDKIAETYAFDPEKPAEPAAPGRYWHRPSLAYGETRYVCAGLYLADLLRANGQPAVWSYRYNVLDPASVPSGNNVSHGSELAAVFGPASPTGLLKSVTPVVQGYWTSFAKHGDPNRERAPGAPVWERWAGAERVLFEAAQTAMENVTEAQAARCRFWSDIAVDLMQ